MKNQIKGHQGDVQFVSLSEIPKSAKEISKKPVALGEHSGHQHVITGDYKMYQDQDFIYADIQKGGAVLQHIHESNFTSFDTKKIIEEADHKPITEILTPNTKFIFGIHRKYDPFLKIWERVAD